MLSHRDPHLLKQKLHLMRTGERKVQQQNLLALVLDEMDAIIHCGSRGSLCGGSPAVLCAPCGEENLTTGSTEDHREAPRNYPNSDSTTLYTSARPESTPAPSFPP